MIQRGVYLTGRVQVKYLLQFHYRIASVLAKIRASADAFYIRMILDKLRNIEVYRDDVVSLAANLNRKSLVRDDVVRVAIIDYGFVI